MQPPSEPEIPLETPPPAPGHDLPTPHAWRQRFWGLRYREVAGPREVCGRLRELAQRWLEPQRRSKEQMLELVVLEQFLAILPRETRSWQWGRGVETCAQAVALAEGVQLGQEEHNRLQLRAALMLPSPPPCAWGMFPPRPVSLRSQLPSDIFRVPRSQ
ncbi:zinc finger protein 496-like [Alligator mississippiensis]|uniref:zinc finger protein 496-like n=1 Tax=Alligator mississippiensis TaxID=8496 RepID=UPI002877D521|nr:zinc finger protein 496-like [Alligator mississippiensis]